MPPEEILYRPVAPSRSKERAPAREDREQPEAEADTAMPRSRAVSRR